MKRNWSAWCQPVFLLLLALAYVVAYLKHPALPGNNLAYPNGWWDWFDQGQYLRAALALNMANLDPRFYFYPPLYPALGAMLLRLSPLHAFFAVDITCFLLFAFFFVDLARRHVGIVVAIALFGISIVHPAELGAVWIEPWTSTVVAPIFAYLFWQIDRLLTNRMALSHGMLMRMGLLGGLVFAARPIDAVVLVPLFLFVATTVFQHCRATQHTTFSTRLLKYWSSLAAPGLIGISFFFGFNWIVHGSLGGTYFQVSTNANGFHPADLAEKAVAIFLDPRPLYGLNAEAVLHRAPQFAIALPGILFSCLYGPLILRLVLLTALVQLCIYLPYADLLPTGVWKYHNVHYFKWMFPYLWLCAAHPLMQLWRQTPERRQRSAKYAISMAFAGLLLCVKFELHDISAQASVSRLDNASPHDRVRITFESPAELDMLFLRSIRGDFTQIYFSNAHSVNIDGRPLQPVRDFRLFEAIPGSAGVNLLFIRPQTVQIVEVAPHELSLADGLPDVLSYRYTFTIGWPAWLPLRWRSGT